MADSEIGSKAHRVDEARTGAQHAEAAAGARLGAEAVQALSGRTDCGFGGVARGGSSDTDNHRKNHGPIVYPLPDVDIHVTVNANPGEVRPGTRVQ